MRYKAACERFVRRWRGGDRLVNSREPRLVRGRKFPTGQMPVGKPWGLWYGCGTAWLEWSCTNNFRLHRYVLAVDVDESRLLRLGTVKRIERFVRDYRDESRAVVIPGVGDIIRAVDWGRVRERWVGVEIDTWQHPYDRRMLPVSCRLPIWYSAWDCASGCLWDLSAVTGWRLVADLGARR